MRIACHKLSAPFNNCSKIRLNIKTKQALVFLAKKWKWGTLLGTPKCIFSSSPKVLVTCLMVCKPGLFGTEDCQQRKCCHGQNLLLFKGGLYAPGGWVWLLEYKLSNRQYHFICSWFKSMPLNFMSCQYSSSPPCTTQQLTSSLVPPKHAQRQTLLPQVPSTCQTAFA